VSTHILGREEPKSGLDLSGPELFRDGIDRCVTVRIATEADPLPGFEDFQEPPISVVQVLRFGVMMPGGQWGVHRWTCLLCFQELG
jgi:hypothetical protein